MPTPPSKPAKAADVARFAISMRYRGEERTTELPLTQDMITQLAVEAAFRGVPICDLIGDLIMGTLQAHARKEAAPVPSWVAEAEPQKQDDIPGDATNTALVNSSLTQSLAMTPSHKISETLSRSRIASSSVQRASPPTP